MERDFGAIVTEQAHGTGLHYANKPSVAKLVLYVSGDLGK